MTDGAKKEQKKALKKIKTTIQKTGSRLAVAGTAAASRQQSRKTRTEKVGTSGNPKKKMSSSVKKAAKEAFDIHPILDAVGFVPVLGEPADFVNGLIYASEEDYINAGLSMAAVIPVIGEAGKMTKYGAKAIEKSKGLKKIGKSVTKPLSKKSSKTYQAGKKSLKKTADDIMDVGSKGGSPTRKPNQVHHYATDKSKTYTQAFKNITDKYGLGLDADWNKHLLPHQGRHPNAYHEYVLDEMRNIDNIANGNRDIFLELYESEIKSIIRDNPDMLYSNYWKGIKE